MTGPYLPVPEDDALGVAASAVVDGVATPEEAAAVAGAPGGAARVAALRAVADAVGAAVPAQGQASAAGALTAALAAFDADLDTDDLDGRQGPASPAQQGRSGPVSPAQQGRSGPVSPAQQGPVPPDHGARSSGPVTGRPARPTGSRSGGGFPRIVAVAAALLLLVGIGAFSVAALQSDEDTATTFTAAAPAQDATETVKTPRPGIAGDGDSRATGGTAVGPGAGAGVPNTGPPAGKTPSLAGPATAMPVVDGGDLGRQDDVVVLGSRVAAALDGVPDPALASPGVALPSDVQVCATAGATTAGEPVGGLRYRAVGTFGGKSAVFLAYDRSVGPPPRLLLVLARTGCDVLASTPF